MYDDGSRTDGFIRHLLPETSDPLELEILIAFRDYGFVDHVELIPPSQLLRVFRIVEKRKRNKPTIPPFYPLYFWEFAG